MAEKFDYHKRAEECAVHAAAAANEQACDVWREMEKYWRRRAEDNDMPLVPDQTSERARDKAR